MMKQNQSDLRSFSDRSNKRLSSTNSTSELSTLIRAFERLAARALKSRKDTFKKAQQRDLTMLVKPTKIEGKTDD